MAYLVVGASGFVGSHVVQALSARKESHVYCVDPHKGSVLESNTNIVYSSSLEEVLPRLFEHDHIDVVYAAYVTSHLLPKRRLTEYSNDIKALSVLLESIASHKSVSIRYLSSSAVYMSSLEEITESHPTHAHNPYALMKLHSEDIVRYFNSQTGHQSLIFRLFTCYGERQNPQTILGKLLLTVLTDSEPVTITKMGSQVRDYIHIDDIVDVLTRDDFPKGFNIYNLCGAERVSIKELAELMFARVVFTGIPDSSDVTIGSSRKLLSDTSWSPRVPLADGLSSLSANKNGKQ